MNEPTTQPSQYLVDIAELNDGRTSLVFTFMPAPDRGNGSLIRGERVSHQYTVKARKDAAGIAFEWSRTSDDPGPAKAEIEREVAARLDDRAVWIKRVTALVTELESWASGMGWSTRRLEKPLDDPWIGKHQVPALLLQQELCRIMVEPIGSSAPGVDGIVDVYLMPAYDDIATLFFYDGRWNVHFAFENANVAMPIRDAEPRPLSPETLKDVLERMRRDAA